MHFSESELKEQLGQMVEILGVESLFSNVTRELEYRPYSKSEDELNMWVSLPDNMKAVVVNKVFLESLLEKLETQGAIEYYERDGAEYKVRTQRYDIYLRLLHFGGVAQYTVNRKTKQKANYAKGMKLFAIQNNIEKYL